MNGTGRPCENPTTNIAVLPLVYFFAQGMCLYLLRSGFSVGLRRAKITEVCAKAASSTAPCQDNGDLCHLPRQGRAWRSG